MSKKVSSKKKIIIAAIVVLILILATAGFLFTKQNDSKTADRQQTSSTAKTTSTAPSAQSDFNSGDDREPQPSAPKTEGTVSDNKGAIGSVPASSQWTSAKSGAITVYSPAKSTKISSGTLITGAASVSRISFRLIDNVSGVISQGDISVVNGKFSGTLNFSTTGSQGRLDVFTTRADGVEENNIEIPVRF